MMAFYERENHKLEGPPGGGGGGGGGSILLESDVSYSDIKSFLKPVKISIFYLGLFSSQFYRSSLQTILVKIKNFSGSGHPLVMICGFFVKYLFCPKVLK